MTATYHQPQASLAAAQPISRSALLMQRLWDAVTSLSLNL